MMMMDGLFMLRMVWCAEVKNNQPIINCSCIYLTDYCSIFFFFYYYRATSFFFPSTTFFRSSFLLLLLLLIIIIFSSSFFFYNSSTTVVVSPDNLVSFCHASSTLGC